MERYLRVNLLGPGSRLLKRIYRAAVSQRLRNTALEQNHWLDGSLDGAGAQRWRHCNWQKATDIMAGGSFWFKASVFGKKMTMPLCLFVNISWNLQQ